MFTSEWLLPHLWWSCVPIRCPDGSTGMLMLAQALRMPIIVRGTVERGTCDDGH